ncbi:MAG: hypothetical protein H6814_00710 [Phycisphaeraceae bacterium]|nr:hypothetical protein [Phycisphaeraceae bacterium]
MLLLNCIGLSLFFAIVKQRSGAMFVTVPLGIFAVWFLRANERKRRVVNVDSRAIRDFEGMFWLIVMVIAIALLIFGAVFGLDWPGRFVVETIRFLSGSE